MVSPEYPYLHARRRAVLAQQGPVERVVVVTEERRRAAIATLGDMVRDARDHETRHAGHRRMHAAWPGSCQLVHCHRNSSLLMG